MKPRPIYAIYSADDYFSQITREVALTKHGDSISLITLLLDPSEPPIAKFMSELVAAADRGVSVQLVIDATSFTSDAHNLPLGPLFFGKDPLTMKAPRYFRDKAMLLERLRGAGGTYTITNTPKPLRLSGIHGGRSHVKAAVINDVAYIGGCNLGYSHQVDAMVRIANPSAARWITKLVADIAKTKNAYTATYGKDAIFKIDTNSTLFFDAGIPGQSIILDEALTFIDQAQRWLVITCQFFPGGETANHLESAVQRGVQVYNIYNHPSSHKTVYPLAHYTIRGREQMRHSKALFSGQLPRTHRRLHTKLIATEQGAMIGSHNYVSIGVKLGTAETALLRKNALFAKEAVATLLRQLDVPNDYPLPMYLS